MTDAEPDSRLPGVSPGLRTLLILGLGAVPALLPAFFAFFFVMAGFGMSERDLFNGLSTAVWGLFGVIGAVSLWVAAFAPMNARIGVGIAAGLLALGPFSFALLVNFVREPHTIMYAGEGWWLTLSMFTPSVVGVWLLTEYAWRTYTGRSGRDTVKRTP